MLLLGDTLIHEQMPPPKEFIRKLKWWLQKRFDSKGFVDHGDALVHGFQQDFTDCGIAAANTAAVEVFQDGLWSNETKIKDRVRWFITLSKRHIQEVPYCVLHSW